MAAYITTYNDDHLPTTGVMVCRVPVRTATAAYPTKPRVGARLVVRDRLEAIGYDTTDTTTTITRHHDQYLVTVVRSSDTTDTTYDGGYDL
jgi:hypothetical protein